MRRCRPLLGTYVEIALDDSRPDPVLLDCVDGAFEAIADIERSMSFHRADSDLSRLNRAEAGDTLTLDAGLVEVLRFAAQLHEATQGVFDPGVADTLVDWNLLPRHGAARPSPHARASIRDLEILDSRRVRLRAPTCIDLGGIAKGFAVDSAVAALVAAGVTQAIVNAGGDLRVLGGPRPIHVRCPDDPRVVRPLGLLQDGAFATSAPYFATPSADGVARSSLVDARTRVPFGDRRSFSVLASTCMAADALTKVLALTGSLPHAVAQQWSAQGFVF